MLPEGREEDEEDEQENKEDLEDLEEGKEKEEGSLSDPVSTSPAPPCNFNWFKIKREFSLELGEIVGKFPWGALGRVRLPKPVPRLATRSFVGGANGFLLDSTSTLARPVRERAGGGEVGLGLWADRATGGAGRCWSMRERAVSIAGGAPT